MDNSMKIKIDENTFELRVKSFIVTRTTLYTYYKRKVEVIINGSKPIEIFDERHTWQCDGKGDMLTAFMAFDILDTMFLQAARFSDDYAKRIKSFIADTIGMKNFNDVWCEIRDKVCEYNTQL